MDDIAELMCPYCYEPLEVYVDPETEGELIEDCAVCCRPCALQVRRATDGELSVVVLRAQ